MDDAMRQWQEELERERAAAAAPGDDAPQRGSFGPPGWRPAAGWRPRSVREGAGMSGWVEAGAALAGSLITLALVLLEGWPPDLDPPTPLYLLAPLGGAAIARMQGPGRLRVALGAFVASTTGVITFCIAVPLLGFLEFLDCWFSWLSDC